MHHAYLQRTAEQICGKPRHILGLATINVVAGPDRHDGYLKPGLLSPPSSPTA